MQGLFQGYSKLPSVRFGDLETSLMEMCYYVCVEEPFVASLVLIDPHQWMKECLQRVLLHLVTVS